MDLRQILEIDVEHGERNIRALSQAQCMLGQHLESSEVIEPCRLVAQNQIMDPFSILLIAT